MDDDMIPYPSIQTDLEACHRISDTPPILYIKHA